MGDPPPREPSIKFSLEFRGFARIHGSMGIALVLEADGEGGEWTNERMTSEREIGGGGKKRALLCESVNKGVIERPSKREMEKNVYAREE